jgi:glycerophosphoryl diester phosphodiesterase
MEHADAAKRLGMKVTEITDVVETGDGHVVTTHDGTRTLVADDGGLVFGVGAPPAKKATAAKKG